MGNYYFCNTNTDVKLSNTAYKVYHVLLSLANNKTKASYPSKDYIAKQAGCCVSSVYNATKELTSQGLIKVTERFNKKVGRQTSNLYTILKEPATQSEAKRVEKKVRIDREVSKKLPGKSLRVYCFLKANTAKDGICGMYLSEIARHVRRSVRTVQRYLQNLVKNKVLEVIHDKGKKSYYRVISVAENIRTKINQSMIAHSDDSSPIVADSLYHDLLQIKEQLGIGVVLNVLI